MTQVKSKKKTSTAPVRETKLTAVQKIGLLEEKLINHEKNFIILAQENDKLKNLITSLAKRLNATIKAGEEGGINNKSVNDMIVRDNVKELEGRITFLQEQGVLKLNNEALTAEKTFVVGRELDESGSELNPRVQFAVGSLDKDIQKKIIGHKVGDLLRLAEGDPELEILEIYEIVDPKIEQNFEESTEETEKVEETVSKTKKAKAKKS